MSEQEFSTVAPLLPGVEAAVLDALRAVFERDGREWSRPIGYRWLRYEDPRPVQRLREGVEKLEGLGASFDAEAVEKACSEAAKRGFSN